MRYICVILEMTFFAATYRLIDTIQRNESFNDKVVKRKLFLFRLAAAVNAFKFGP